MQRLWSWGRFVARDLFAKRAGAEVYLGGISIAAGTASLLVVLVFTQGVYRFVDACFRAAKPVIGSVIVDLKGSGVLQQSQVAELLRDIETRIPGEVESVSWCSTIRGEKDNRGLRVNRSLAEEFHLQPSMWCLPYEAAHILDPANGVKYVFGNRFSAPESDSIPPFNGGRLPPFGVILNTRFLQDDDGLRFSEKDIKAILKGDLRKLPKEIWFHFPPVAAVGGKAPFEPGTIPIPVRGVVSLPDRIFPHLFLSPEVAAAFHHAGQSWKPSFALQFRHVDSDEPLVPPTRYTDADGTEFIDRKGPKWDSLPSTDALDKIMSVRSANGLKPTVEKTTDDVHIGPTAEPSAFSRAILMVHGFREPGIRSKIKQKLEEPELVVQIRGAHTRQLESWLKARDTDSLGRILDTLELKRRSENERPPADELTLTGRDPQRETRDHIETVVDEVASQHNKTAARAPRRLDIAKPISAGDAWRVSGEGWSTRYQLLVHDDELVIQRETPWRVENPSDTVSEALNQVAQVVWFYSTAISWAIGLLSALIALLLGIGYIHRKRKDIGILKSFGTTPIELGAVYGIQVLAVCVLGAIAGVLLAYGLAYSLDPWASRVIGEYQLDYASAGKVMVVGMKEVAATLTVVIGGAILGLIYPCWKAMTIDPIEDLRTGL